MNHSGNERQNDDGGILERAPRTVEQKGNEAVLDEVEPLDDVHLGNGGRGRQRVRGGACQGDRKRTIPRRPV